MKIDEKDIIQKVPFFTRFKENTDKVERERIKCEVLELQCFLGDILEVAKDTSDLNWIFETLLLNMDVVFKERYAELYPEKYIEEDDEVNFGVYFDF